MIKFGCCLPAGSFAPQLHKNADHNLLMQIKDGIEQLHQIGYDFAELTVGSLMQLSEEEFQSLIKYVNENNLSVPVLNSFIPPSIKLTGPNVEKFAVEIYLEKALRRAKMLDSKLIIFGSGAARSYPYDFNENTAMEQIVDFLVQANDIAVNYQVDIAIEPLNRLESNVVNTLEEALNLCETLQLSNIRVLADTYHMLNENENLNRIAEAVKSGVLSHIHISDRDRAFPGTIEQDGVEFATLFSILQTSGYNGFVSAECQSDQFNLESESSLKYVKNLWNEEKRAGYSYDNESL